ERVHGPLAGRPERDALGAAADRPRDVEPRRGLASAREDEALQRLERLLCPVPVAPRGGGLRPRPAPPCLRVLPRDREVGAEIEEIVLDAPEPLVARLDLSPSHDRVELVDRAVGTDERVELGDPRAVPEARLPPVAAACVDLRQADRLVGPAAHPCASW